MDSTVAITHAAEAPGLGIVGTAMDDTSPLIEIRALFKSYRRGDQIIPVLSDISLDTAQG